MHKISIAVLVLAVASSLVAVEGKWTVMVYMASDNNLEPAAIDDFLEMAGVGSNENLNILARVDRSAKYTSTPLLDLGDFTGAKDVIVNKDSITELRDLGEINTQDPDNIISFITYAIENYPADHYGVIFWDHGGGWIGFGEDGRLSRRRATGDLLLPWVIADAVRTALDTASVTKLDFLGFDACLMATQETAHQFAGVANYYIGSEELEPGEGYDYGSLSLLADDGDYDTAAFLTRVAADFSRVDAAPLTLVVLDLTKVVAFTDALTTLAGKLTTKLSDALFFQLISRARGNSLSMSQTPSEKDRLSLVDIGNFFETLIDTLTANGGYSSTIADITAAKTAFNRMIVSFSRDETMVGATGVTIYFPRKVDDYDDVGYTDVPDFGFWKSFLDTFTSPPPVTPPSKGSNMEVTESYLGGNPSWSATVTVLNPESVSYGYFEFGVYDDTNPDIYYSLGYDRAEMDIKNGILSGDWDGYFYTACAGLDCYPVYGALWPSLDGRFFWVSLEFSFVFAADAPGGVYSPESVLSAYFNFAVDPITAKATNESLFVYFPDGGVSEHELETGDILIPLIQKIDTTTNDMSWVAWGDFAGISYDAETGLDLEAFHVNALSCWASMTLLTESIDGAITQIDYKDFDLCPPPLVIPAPPRPTLSNPLLEDLPAAFSASSVLTCEAAGATGGCSGCVLGLNGLCDWVTLTEDGLAQGQRSTHPFGGVRGVCVPKGLWKQTEFMLDFYGTAYGESGISAKYIALTNNRCPRDPAKEPRLMGYGLSPNDAEVFTAKFDSEFCELPTKPYFVDRSAFAASKPLKDFLGSRFEEDFNINGPAPLLCNAINSAEGSPSKLSRYINRKFLGSPEDNGAKFSLRTYLDSGLMPRTVPTLEKLRQCLALNQATICTAFCPAYGERAGVFVCPEAFETIHSACKDVVPAVFGPNPFKKRIFPLAFGLADMLFGQSFSSTSLASLNAKVAEAKAAGFEPSCIDPFKNRASKRFLAELDNALSCENPSNKGLVAECDGKCTIVYGNSQNCGACGNVCAAGQICFKGVCKLDLTEVFNTA